MPHSAHGDRISTLRAAVLVEASAAGIALDSANVDQIVRDAIGPNLLRKLQLHEDLTGAFIFEPESNFEDRHPAAETESENGVAVSVLLCVAQAFENSFPGTRVFLDERAFDAHLRCHYWT